MKDNVVDMESFKAKLAERQTDVEFEIEIEPEKEHSESNDPFTDEQVDTILLALIMGRKADDAGDEHLEEEIYAVIDWAYETFYKVTALNQILKGNATVRWDRDTGEIKLGKAD